MINTFVNYWIPTYRNTVLAACWRAALVGLIVVLRQ
jgi:hypothetical protein